MNSHEITKLLKTHRIGAKNSPSVTFRQIVSRCHHPRSPRARTVMAFIMRAFMLLQLMSCTPPLTAAPPMSHNSVPSVIAHHASSTPHHARPTYTTNPPFLARTAAAIFGVAHLWPLLHCRVTFLCTTTWHHPNFLYFFVFRPFPTFLTFRLFDFLPYWTYLGLTWLKRKTYILIYVWLIKSSQHIKW